MYAPAKGLIKNAGTNVAEDIIASATVDPGDFW
jgi:hypothetical protein